VAKLDLSTIRYSLWCFVSPGGVNNELRLKVVVLNGFIVDYTHNFYTHRLDVDHQYCHADTHGKLGREIGCTGGLKGNPKPVCTAMVSVSKDRAILVGRKNNPASSRADGLCVRSELMVHLLQFNSYILWIARCGPSYQQPIEINGYTLS
jgi:hypothetical protein